MFLQVKKQFIDEHANNIIIWIGSIVQNTHEQIEIQDNVLINYMSHYKKNLLSLLQFSSEKQSDRKPKSITNNFTNL